MSHRITIGDSIEVTEIFDFPVNVEKAFSIDGTPADCVKIAVEYIMDEKPDIVFSGINRGYNAGMDVEYSGTVAAAMEAVMKEIPAAAFSMYADDDYRLVDEWLYDIMGRLIHMPAGEGKIWNVNFPGCRPELCRGALWNRKLAKAGFFPDIYVTLEEEGHRKTVSLQSSPVDNFEKDTDLYALLKGHISIGTITNMVMGR